MTTADLERACEGLATVVHQLASEHRDWLEESKANAIRDLDDPDFVWRALVMAAATLGNSRGYEGLFGKAQNYNKITFVLLARSSPKARLRLLFETLSSSKVRMSKKKAEFLAENFETIEGMGGPAEAKKKLNRLRFREAMMAFMRQFRGIGEKYSRDIFMDVYHPEFRQSIAVDVRVQSILKSLGISLKPYPEGERFCLKVAEKAGLSGWELDRLLYKFKKEIEDNLVNLPCGAYRDKDGVLTIAELDYSNGRNAPNKAFPSPLRTKSKRIRKHGKEKKSRGADKSIL